MTILLIIEELNSRVLFAPPAIIKIKEAIKITEPNAKTEKSEHEQMYYPELLKKDYARSKQSTYQKCNAV